MAFWLVGCKRVEEYTRSCQPLKGVLLAGEGSPHVPASKVRSSRKHFSPAILLRLQLEYLLKYLFAEFKCFAVPLTKRLVRLAAWLGIHEADMLQVDWLSCIEPLLLESVTNAEGSLLRLVNYSTTIIVSKLKIPRPNLLSSLGHTPRHAEGAVFLCWRLGSA